jgi:hypothetical protein
MIILYDFVLFHLKVILISRIFNFRLNIRMATVILSLFYFLFLRSNLKNELQFFEIKRYFNYLNQEDLVFKFVFKFLFNNDDI